ncbi:MAG: MopE-related protein [Myxococcota bacterium]
MRYASWMLVAMMLGCHRGSVVLKATEDGSAEEVPSCEPAEEVCDGVDNDCDGEVDEGLLIRTFQDADGDGYGDVSSPIDSCVPPVESVEDSTDCDDSNPEIHPGEEESCDGADNNCDGNIDEGLDTSIWYVDADADGHGDPAGAVSSCAQPVGMVEAPGDCNDGDDSIYPGAEEVCDGTDQDCDELVDEDVTLRFYADGDRDGFGTEDDVQDACSAPDGYSAVPGDCDDFDGSIHPGVEDSCDGVDQDCDGAVDEDGDAVVYADVDSDGYGDADSPLVSCSPVSGFVEDSSDCVDTDAAIHPGASDVECDGVDNDCDGVIDDGAEDTDGDGLSDCIDSTIYEDSFEDESWGEWSIVDFSGDEPPVEDWGVGPADWYFSSGLLCEESDIGNEIALSPDLGVLDLAYAVEVSVVSLGSRNNGVGLVFDYQSSDSMKILVWEDPTDSYEWYDPPGQIGLYQLLDGAWSTIATDSSGLDLSVEEDEWATLKVEVEGDVVSAFFNGTEVLTRETLGVDGPGQVGVWTWDNDGGVCFSDVLVSLL